MVRRWGNQGNAGHGITLAGNILVHLVTGQLAAFSGLGALSYFNLQYFSINQIMRGYTETARGNLLDFGYFNGIVTGRVFTALTGIGTGTQAVHGFCQSFMGFW